MYIRRDTYKNAGDEPIDGQKSLFFTLFFAPDVQKSLFFIWFFGFRGGQNINVFPHFRLPLTTPGIKSNPILVHMAKSISSMGLLKPPLGQDWSTIVSHIMCFFKVFISFDMVFICLFHGFHMILFGFHIITFFMLCIWFCMVFMWFYIGFTWFYMDSIRFLYGCIWI